MKKRKIGIILILIGVGIPLVLFFFQEDGKLEFKSPAYKEAERKLNPDEIKAIEKIKDPIDKFLEKLERSERWIIRGKFYLIPYKYTIGIGLILVLTGVGIVIFSFFPKEKKSKK